MILYASPYSTSQKLGMAYDEIMERAHADDWVCFMDGDAMFSTDYYGHQIEECIAKYQDGGCFTCYTNRVWCPWQVHDRKDWESDSLVYHRQRGQELAEKYKDSCTLIPSKMAAMSGVMFVISKKTWTDIGGVGDVPHKILGVDNQIYQRLQRRGKLIYRMNGVYVIHWYRGGEYKNKGHLMRPYNGQAG